MKINLIFNENPEYSKEQSRLLERMGLKDELAIVSDEHLSRFGKTRSGLL